MLLTLSVPLTAFAGDGARTPIPAANVEATVLVMKSRRESAAASSEVASRDVTDLLAESDGRPPALTAVALVGAIERRAEELPSKREKQLEGEVTELRERIQVLERIATDANSSEAIEAKRIAAEIESLRATDKEA